MQAIFQKKTTKYLLTTLRFILPAIILVIIFRQIDLVTLKSYISRTDIRWAIIGIAYCPIVVLIGGIRWETITREYFRKKLSVGFFLRHYWIGLTLGFFAPASLGWDVYKIAVAGRKYGNYLRNTAAIIIEKIMAFLSICFLIVILFPFVSKYVRDNSEFVQYISQTAGYILFILVAAIFCLALLTKHRFILWIDGRVNSIVKQIYVKVLKMSKRSDVSTDVNISFLKLLSPLTDPFPLLKIIVLSLAIQIVSAIGNQILFRAVGYPIPVMVNLFLCPIFFFIFILPISFGSIGIREGAYILLYGFFGVPQEIALLVSFLNFGGIILNQIIGALLITTCNGLEKDMIFKRT